MQMTTEDGIFPHISHVQERLELALRGQKTKYVYATAASAVGSCPSANAQSRGEEDLQAARCSWRGSALAAKPHVQQPQTRVPTSPVPVLLGWLKFCGHYLRAKSKGAQGDLLASSA